MPPEEAMAHPLYPQAAEMGTQALIGSTEEVVAGLYQLADDTGASELMLFTSTFDLADRLTSFELIAAEHFSPVPAST